MRNNKNRSNSDNRRVLKSKTEDFSTDKSKTKSYKSKRSFSKNKSFRELKSKDAGDKPKRAYEQGGFKKKENKFTGFKRTSVKSYVKSDAQETTASGKKKRFSKPRKNEESSFTKRFKHSEFEEGKAFQPQAVRESFADKKFGKKKSTTGKPAAGDGTVRLNKYLSNAGIASRRDADNLILSGTVKVNGKVVNTLGTKIGPNDKVTYGDSAVKTERKVYLLLNKPKDYITTVEDPRERKTVMELIKGACRERVYPVGRLDRNTTGLLLFTNDGEMTKKLTHPKFGIKKVYHVSLNKGLKPEDFKAISEGLELEDGVVKADDLAFVGEGKKEIGIEIHSGRNRIVRRIFEHLGYDVLKLDRVVFAGLTKKDLPRGKHRFLTGKEISFLQMIG